MFDRFDRETLHQILREVECIHRDVQRILRLMALQKVDFIQLEGSLMNFSIVAGSGGTFAALFTPPNGTQAPGTTPTWTASDPSVSLTPSADGSSVVANVAPGGISSFTLTLSATSSDSTQGSGGVLTATHTIAVTQPVPPPTPLTAVDFNQTAG